MAERDDGFLAPLDIKDKAEAYVKELRIAEDTNYDEADNKYDAIRHIGASLALYAQYPDLASDVILGAKEYVGSIGDPRGKKMDLHNNAIGKELYKMLDEEQADNLTTEQALEIAKSYVEEWDLAEKEGRKLDLPEEMKPLMYYGATKEPESEDGGLYEIGPEGTWVEKAQMSDGGLMADPLVLSETAEEEAEPKMGVGEYVEGIRQFGEDLSPAGTAQAVIDTAKESYKLATGDEDASVMNLLMSGIGAIPGGKQAGKVIQASGRFGKQTPETTFGIGDTVAPPVDRRSAKKVKDVDGNIADFHGGMGAKVDDIYVGEDGKTKVVVRYTKDTDEINPETNTPVFEEVTQTFDADQAEKAGLEALVKGKQPEIIPVKLAESEDMAKLDRILTSEYRDPDDIAAVMEAIAGDLYQKGKLGDVKIGKRFKNQNGDIVEVTGVDADLAPYPAKELAGKSDRIYFEVGVNKPVGVRIQYNNLTKGTQGSDIFDSFKNKKYEEVTGELKAVEQPKTGLMADELTAVEPMEVGFDEALQSGKFLKNYDNTVATDMAERAKTARTGARGETDLLMAEVPEGTRVGVRLNLNSKIEGMPKGLDKLQTLHKGTYSGKAMSYQPYVVLRDVKFNVSQPGRTGIAANAKGIDTPEAKNKFPMSSADGEYVPNANLLEGNTDDLVEIGFNPVEYHLFYDLNTGQAVKGADEAMVIGDRVYARGVKYWKKSEAPEPKPTKSGVDVPSKVRFKEMNTGGLMSDAYNRAES